MYRSKNAVLTESQTGLIRKRIQSRADEHRMNIEDP